MQPRRARRQPGSEPSAPPGGDGRRPWVVAVGWGIVGVTACVAAAVAALAVPAPHVPPPTVIYDRYDRPVARLTPRNRIPVPLSEIPLDLQHAVLAAEDARFYDHHGINPAAILRAAWVDLRAGRVVEGGSTITQQLAKNLFLSPSRTLARKVLELLYTLKLEAVYSKRQILQMYLNSIYLGEGTYGVEAAAETYFGKHVADLDLDQAALLAGLPRGPSIYDPFTHPKAALARRNEVLRRMAADGFVPAAAARAAAARPLALARAADRPARAGYFVEYVQALLADRFPDLAKGGYRVYTTLDTRLQDDADWAFRRYMPPGRPDAGGVTQPEGAMVVLDPRNGAVRAMIGGRDYPRDPWNRAVDARRQPGSTFKPFLYAVVFDEGYSTVDRQFDGPVEYPGVNGGVYRPTDYGEKPYLMRDVSVRQAMAISDNVVAVKWAAQVGPERVIQMARRCGVTSPLAPTLPLVLGSYEVTPLELTDAYIPFDNGGLAIPAWAVRRVEDAAGHVLYQPSPPRPRRAMDPGVAYLVTSVLQSVMAEGTGRNLAPIVGDRPLAGKTGTTNDLKDAWFVGYTPDLVAGVWVGDDTPADLHGYGDSLAGPVWAHFMARALAGTPPHDWRQPDDVVAMPVSAVDGLLPNPTSPIVDEVFLRGTEPREVSPVYAGGSGGAIVPGPAGAGGSAAPPDSGAGPAPAGPGAAQGAPRAPAPGPGAHGPAGGAGSEAGAGPAAPAAPAAGATPEAASPSPPPAAPRPASPAP
jgi:1A family penicillin-binding protein